MALCSLCRDIPFASLAEPPPYPGGYFVADNEEIPVIGWFEDEEKTMQEDPLGFPWHQSLDALAVSADSCTLCAAIQNGVKIWLNHFKDAEKNPVFVEFHKDYDKVPTGQRLWITKRYGKAPGLLVFARHLLRRHMIFLITGVSFSVDAGSSSARALRLRPMDLDSGSLQSLDIAASFVQTCIQNHERCTSGDSALPSRILDLGEAGDVIKLVGNTEGQVGKYACLSYCWGEAPHFTTTQESIEARRAGIRLTDLPRTFFDAIMIVRHLQLRYIWIDALCICQDDVEDWARESAQMVDVYSGAYVVIANDRAKNNSEGCFHIREPRPTNLVDLPGYADGVQVQYTFNSDELYCGIEKRTKRDPLLSRAWALQERLLARRNLHYAERQVYFECNHGIVGEDGSSSENRYLSLSHPQPTYSTRGRLKLAAGHDQQTWDLIIWEYGRRKLTKPTDKFPAMSGLAKLFGQRLQAEYVAGLWSNALINGLAWQGLGDRSPQASSPVEYIGPSWSWASYSGIAATGLNDGWETIAEVVDWQVQLETEANPYGKVQNAWIRLRAPITSIAPLTPAKQGTLDHEIRLQRIGRTPLPRFQSRYSNKEEGRFVKFDDERIEQTGSWKELDLHVLILGGYPRKDKVGKLDDESEENKKEVDSGSYFGLVVAGVDEYKPEAGMKRLGWTFLDRPENPIAEDDPDWRTVTLF
ncbi:HET-domain-containing protein [Xylariaceae sp. FL1651]|nr:HET-domain-containing protein [Xylariaceae sp. FL1651]